MCVARLPLSSKSGFLTSALQTLHYSPCFSYFLVASNTKTKMVVPFITAEVAGAVTFGIRGCACSSWFTHVSSSSCCSLGYLRLLWRQ
ncbi:unnamed protein product [Amoebophrya sp. A25]|nr:unnamed protein product [Amoebophrya sp. A25]|eukprot:GSA25T00023989001.1